MKELSGRPFRIEALNQRHKREDFTCGVEALDRYLQRYAAQDLRKRVAAVFVLTADGSTIAGFYTLSSHLVYISDLPPELARRVPRYPAVPTTLLGRLAISQDFRGLGLGEFLLMDALNRSLEASRKIASTAVVVDAKDDAARDFYLRYGFIQLPSNPSRLLCPMRTIEALFTV